MTAFSTERFATIRTTILLLAASATGLMGCLPQVKATPAAATTKQAITVASSNSPLGSSANVLSLTPNRLSVSPSSTTKFVASGGVPPYRFFLTAGSGSVDMNTGAYTALAGNGSAQVQVFDASFQTSTAFIQIGTGNVNPPANGGTPSGGTPLAVNPTSITLSLGLTYTFTASGGTAPYTYRVVGSGTINSTSGLYSAPGAITRDQVIVTDHAGISVSALVDVAPRTVVIWRSRNPDSTAHLYSLNGGEGPMMGWTNEGAAARVYEAAGVAGTVPLYRCVDQMSHFISLNANCDGRTMESILGYVYASSSPGTKALNQYISPVLSDHYVTLVNPVGTYAAFSLENVLGYAFDP